MECESQNIREKGVIVSEQVSLHFGCDSLDVRTLSLFHQETVSRKHLVRQKSLHFITNRNRNFIFGDGPFDSSDSDRLPRKENHGRILMGLYGHWGKISGPKL